MKHCAKDVKKPKIHVLIMEYRHKNNYNTVRRVPSWWLLKYVKIAKKKVSYSAEEDKASYNVFELGKNYYCYGRKPSRQSFC